MSENDKINDLYGDNPRFQKYFEIKRYSALEGHMDDIYYKLFQADNLDYAVGKGNPYFIGAKPYWSGYTSNEGMPHSRVSLLDKMEVVVTDQNLVSNFEILNLTINKSVLFKQVGNGLGSLLKQGALHDIFFGNNATMYDGIAFYFMPVRQRYNWEFGKSFAPEDWWANDRASNFLLSAYSGLNYPRVLFLYQEKLFSHLQWYKYSMKNFVEGAHNFDQGSAFLGDAFSMFVGRQYGALDKNNLNRMLYNNANPPLLIPHKFQQLMLDMMDVYRTHRSGPWLYRKYTTTHMIGYAGTHPVDRCFRGLLAEEYAISSMWLDLGKPHRSYCDNFMAGRPYLYDNLVYYMNNTFYTPTFTVSPEVMNLIYNHQNWNSLLIATEHEVQRLYIHSKELFFYDIEHVYIPEIASLWSDEFVHFYTISVCSSFVLGTLSELIRETEIGRRLYLKFVAPILDYDYVWNWQGLLERPFSNELAFIGWHLFLISWYGFINLHFMVHENILNRILTKVPPDYDVENRYIIQRVNYFYSVTHSQRDRFYNRFEESDVDAEYSFHWRFKDYKKTLRATEKLAFDQGLYNFYRERNGYFAGTSYFNHPGKAHIEASFTYPGGWIYFSDAYRQFGKPWGYFLTSLDLPTWHQRTMDLDFHTKRYRDYHCDAFQTLSRRLDDNHKLDSYLHHWRGDLQPRFYTDYYDGILNEANKSPLYDSELFRIRYGFNPHSSSLTSYGSRAFRIDDYIATKNIYNTIHNTDSLDILIIN